MIYSNNFRFQAIEYANTSLIHMKFLSFQRGLTTYRLKVQSLLKKKTSCTRKTLFIKFVFCCLNTELCLWECQTLFTKNESVNWFSLQNKQWCHFKLEIFFPFYWRITYHYMRRLYFIKITLVGWYPARYRTITKNYFFEGGDAGKKGTPNSKFYYNELLVSICKCCVSNPSKIAL